MPVDVNMYLDPNNINVSITAAKSIAQRLNLAVRPTAKNYGEIKESDEYSDFFTDWNEFDDTYLRTTKNTKNPLYSLWSAIKERCYNSKSIGFYCYGGNGIGIYSEWKEDFCKFASYVLDNLGKKPERYFSIDRIDGTKNYEPDNIRWAAPLKQSRNKLGGRKQISEKDSLILAYLYKYYTVTGAILRDIYNDCIVEDPSKKITKSWQVIYKACKSYCPFV